MFHFPFDMAAQFLQKTHRPSGANASNNLIFFLLNLMFSYSSVTYPFACLTW